MEVLARTLAALLAVAPVAARSRPPLEPYVEHALDIAFDPGSHVGKRYRVTGCLFRGVQVDEVVCEIHRGAGGPPPR